MFLSIDLFFILIKIKILLRIILFFIVIKNYLLSIGLLVYTGHFCEN